MGELEAGVQFVRSSDGATIAMQRAGSGVPLLDVPAWFSGIGHDHWTMLGVSFDGYERITYDRRGFGLSARGPQPTDWELYVADARAVAATIDSPTRGWRHSLDSFRAPERVGGSSQLETTKKRRGTAGCFSRS